MGAFSPTQLTTQDHLDVEEVRDNVVVLKNGSVGMVIQTNAVNFELLAEQEQDASIFTFANLLNSLNFPIQIVIRTVSTDVSKYIGQLSSYQKSVNNRSLNAQVDIYKDFIANLTENTNILDKNFYVVIPTKSFEPVKNNAIRQLFGKRQKLVNVDKIIKTALGELEPKRDHIIKQFNNMGIQAWQMTNDELIKLYYSIYEPDKTGLGQVTQADITAGLVNTK